MLPHGEDNSVCPFRKLNRLLKRLVLGLLRCQCRFIQLKESEIPQAFMAVQQVAALRHLELFRWKNLLKGSL
ncbi:hypothetical protein D3C85_1895700 [compost metagenome]